MEQNIFITLHKVYDILVSIANREVCNFEVTGHYSEGNYQTVRIYPKYNGSSSQIAINDEENPSLNNTFFSVKTRENFAQLNEVFSFQKQLEFKEMFPKTHMADLAVSLLMQVNINSPNQKPYLKLLKQKCASYQTHHPEACALAQSYLLSKEIVPLPQSMNDIGSPKKTNKI